MDERWEDGIASTPLRHAAEDSGVARLLGALRLSGHHQHAGGQDCALVLLVKILSSNSMLEC